MTDEFSCSRRPGGSLDPKRKSHTNRDSIFVFLYLFFGSHGPLSPNTMPGRNYTLGWRLGWLGWLRWGRAWISWGNGFVRFGHQSPFFIWYIEENILHTGFPTFRIDDGDRVLSFGENRGLNTHRAFNFAVASHISRSFLLNHISKPNTDNLSKLISSDCDRRSTGR